jgi:glycosyltransferase involved in cell wall biosynthesis
LRTALNQAGVEVLTPLAGQRPLDTLAAAQAWVAERDWRRIDVVHAELGGGRHSEFLALCALARLPKHPALSATIHDPERIVWRPVSRLWAGLERTPFVPRLARQAVALLSDPHTLWAERRLARKLDGLVALTDMGASRLATRMRLEPSRVSVIPHGTLNIPPATLPPLSPVRLLYFGFIYSGKGIEDLIDALGQVRAEHPERADQLRLTIAGGTAPDIAFGTQGSYLDSLRARAEALGLADHIDWVLDVDERDIAALVQRHHVMVLPYRESRKLSLMGQMRGTSGALAWAIGCGRGAITSDARAFAEEIKQGNGVAYPQGDVAALAAHLTSLLDQPALITEWAQRAADVGRQRVWSQTGQAFAQHFEAACQRANPNPWGATKMSTLHGRESL